ncbi:carbamate kinase [Paramesorhizobium deserti]|uniref:Carbamate kinase n=1 Tax=Paramesorhizobium deserti TaxID=1494590 RepID=A0A135HR71_9HYPH|nr:carbamate kinase [Paramesorhizobium deserti]KXF75705.1 carbamate kinase [Paramesorhizobium deserti]
MLAVIALGGNALLKRGEPLTAENQRANVKRAVTAIAEVVSAGHRVVVCHGNGPQVGLLALQSAAYKSEEAYPLDVLGAETEGMIGYLIEQELENALPDGPRVATLLTQVEVDPADPAFDNPTKPVGPVYEKGEAEWLAATRGWVIAPDGDKYRRVVASPLPKHIPDVSIIKLLLDQGVIVICAGGGGIPVVRRADGSLTGVEAVIDKDRAAELLARNLGADALVMLTDVDAVYQNWGEPGQKAIGEISPDEIDAEDFPAGSMRPKIEAACNFALVTGGMAGIGALQDALGILERRAGTVIAGRPE